MVQYCLVIGSPVGLLLVSDHRLLSTHGLQAMSRYFWSAVCRLCRLCRLPVSVCTIVNCCQTARGRQMVTMKHHWEVDIGLAESAKN